MRALILAGGDQPDPALLDVHWPGWRDVALVIAADGGARHAAPLGLPLHQVVGDFDSLRPSEIDDLAMAGVQLSRFPTSKDATDTELALISALDAGASEIILLGTWGGRSDHAIGTLTLLAHPRCREARVMLMDAVTRTRLAQSGDVIRLTGVLGRVISLTPWAGDAVVSISGVRWALDHERLSAGSTRGMSNIATSGESIITVHDGALFISEGGAAA